MANPSRPDRRGRRYRTTFVATLAVAALVGTSVACSGSDDDDAADTLAPVPTASPVTTAAAPTVAPTTDSPATSPPTTSPPTTSPPTTEPATTLPPTTAAPATTAAAVEPTATPTTAAAAELRLQRDGLGIAAFGTDADAAVAAVTAALGDPSDDSGWVDPITVSTCAGPEVRRVSWGTLSLLLGDPAGGDTGVRQFFAYSYGDVAELGAPPAGLATPEGLGLGAPVEDLQTVYPDVEVTEGEEGLIESSFYVDDSLRGLLTGADAGGTVTVIFGGPYCG